jgi:nucleolar protein 53
MFVCVIIQALALELKRKEEEARKAGALVPPPSASSSLPGQALGGEDDEVQSDQSSGSDDDDEDGEEEDPGASQGGGSSRRRKGKLTTAQRNRQRRVKQQSHEEQQARASKRLEKDITRTDLFLKAIEEEHDRISRNKELRELKAQTKAVDPTALHKDEVNAVPLSDELRGSLRRLTPRGGHVADRVEEMRRAGELSGRDRKRRRNEKPHGSRRVVWVPKYKTT